MWCILLQMRQNIFFYVFHVHFTDSLYIKIMKRIQYTYMIHVYVNMKIYGN